MSAPSSDGRRSLSSEPSATSSRTLHSTTSGTHVDNGEGSSSHAPSPPSRHRGGTANGDYTGARAASQGSGSSRPLAPEAIDEQDFAHRRPRAGRTGGGFLLDSAFPSGPRNRHSRRAPDSKGKGLRVPRTRSSRLDAPPAERANMDSAPRPPVDPNQLVHMALNLSESRRRNISASALLGSPRAPSGAQREGSLSHAGGSSSLRQYLNEQRRVSRNISPMGKASPSRHMSGSMQRSASAAFAAAQPVDASPATLVRRDKARAYMELRAEYMRLLDVLPPLKDDANAPGNFNYTGFAVPGSPHAYLSRTPSHANKKHELGRPYNPIQALRNRRSRARERLPLPQEPAAFADSDHVHEWIDEAVEQSKKPGFRLDDRVALPHLHADRDLQPAQPKPSKSQQGWSITPEELLADAYWLEQGDSKTVIEDRHGRKIFPPRDPPKQPKNDLLAPRASKDSSTRRSWVDGVSGTDPGTGDESEQGSERGRKRRLLPKMRANSRLRTGNPRRHSRGYSDSSDTDEDVRKVRGSVDVERSTGPLQLQMKRQLELQTQGLSNKTPALDTPDTPDKWGRAQHDAADGRTSRSSLEAPRFANGSAAGVDENATLKLPPRSRTNPLTPIKSAEPRSSLEDDSTAPSTPLHMRHFPHIGSDLSPPPSRDGSERGKSKRSKLNPFNSLHDHDKHQAKRDAEHAGPDKTQTSRPTSEELQEPGGFGNAIFAAPGAVKNLLGHRKNDSVSSLDSPDKPRRKGAQDPNKEPPSAVTRFFKGVKHEGTKVGDIIFRRDRADDEDGSTASDRNSVEFDDDERRRPGLSRTVTSTTAASISSDKDGRSHLKLPSFRPVHESLSDNDTASDLEHHISRQSRDRRNDRSARIDRLLPPRMDLERVSSSSTTATLGPARSQEHHGIETQLTRPGGVVYGFPGTLPPTALKNAQSRRRSASRPTLDGKRHWSITDDDEHAKRKKRQSVSQADIARVRALFLCSGVKAKEISRRANSPRDLAPGFLRLAAETAEQQLFPVPRTEEHVLAARILVTDLERSTSALHRVCEELRSGTIKDLNARIHDLRDSIENDLMPHIFEASDKAVQITSEVSGQGPLHVKQINDEIDRMLRRRRRHTRWVMNWGWSAVEWSIVVALRMASIVFAMYGLAKSIVVFFWSIVKWLLWL